MAETTIEPFRNTRFRSVRYPGFRSVGGTSGASASASPATSTPTTGELSAATVPENTLSGGETNPFGGGGLAYSDMTPEQLAQARENLTLADDVFSFAPSTGTGRAIGALSAALPGGIGTFVQGVGSLYNEYGAHPGITEAEQEVGRSNPAALGSYISGLSDEAFAAYNQDQAPHQSDEEAAAKGGLRGAQVPAAVPDYGSKAPAGGFVSLNPFDDNPTEDAPYPGGKYGAGYELGKDGSIVSAPSPALAETGVTGDQLASIEQEVEGLINSNPNGIFGEGGITGGAGEGSGNPGGDASAGSGGSVAGDGSYGEDTGGFGGYHAGGPVIGPEPQTQGEEFGTKVLEGEFMMDQQSAAFWGPDTLAAMQKIAEGRASPEEAQSLMMNIQMKASRPPAPMGTPPRQGMRPPGGLANARIEG